MRVVDREIKPIQCYNADAAFSIVLHTLRNPRYYTNAANQKYCDYIEIKFQTLCRMNKTSADKKVYNINYK